MKIYIKISFLITLILALVSCQDSERKEIKESWMSIDYGKWTSQNDSLGVELKLSKFKNFRELLLRTENIVCNDSLPKLIIKNERRNKTIYFQNPCWEDYVCILIKQKNVIEIHNDTIYKSWDLTYPMDSLENVMRRDLENFGKNPDLADDPSKFLIYISYDSLQPDKLYRTLDGLTDIYSKITDSTNIKIWLNERFDFIPPPAPESPVDIEEIEFVE